MSSFSPFNLGLSIWLCSRKYAGNKAAISENTEEETFKLLLEEEVHSQGPELDGYFVLFQANIRSIKARKDKLVTRVYKNSTFYTILFLCPLILFIKTLNKAENTSELS